MYNFFSKRLNGNRKGFTLVELLVVMAILAVLIAIAVMNMGTTTVSAKVSKHNSQVRELYSAGTMWFANNVNNPALDTKVKTSPYEIPAAELIPFFNQGAIPKSEFGGNEIIKVYVTKNGEVAVKPGLFKVEAGQGVADGDATDKLQGIGWTLP